MTCILCMAGLVLISAPSDSEEDLLIPTYLILDEDKIKDEQKFASLVDRLVAVYSELLTQFLRIIN